MSPVAIYPVSGTHGSVCKYFGTCDPCGREAVPLRRHQLHDLTYSYRCGYGDQLLLAANEEAA